MKDKDKSKQFTKGVQVMNSKVSKVIAEEKLQFVYSMYLQEYKTSEIIQAFTDKYGDTSRNCTKYIKKVKEMVKTVSTSDNHLLVKKIALQYQDLYHQNYLEKKWKDAADCLNKMSNLLGLEAPKKLQVEQTVKQIDLTKLSDEMIDKLLSEGYDEAEVVE